MATCTSTLRFNRTPVVAAALLLGALAHAQTATTLNPVTVTGRGDPAIDVSGWGDIPLSKAPFQASIISREQMRELGVQRLADVVRIDPSVSDAYNTEGYWDFLTVRGFVIDNRSNYRRDGLPINAETAIPLANKDSVEILKGTSGLQAGTSAPGGLVNFVVKRPTAEAWRDATIEWRQNGTLVGSADISQRFGVDRVFGLRVNAMAAHYDPRVRDAKGDGHLLSLAGEWRVTPDSLLEAEVESSHQSQPSVPGFSMLGNVVPAPVDPRINLNNQPWSLPVVLDGNTASIRFTQRLDADWRFTAHAATQRLKSDDRIAFPFGCGAEGNFDRYCSDGTFDLYDYRSENERRRSDALQLAVQGSLKAGDVSHAVTAGVLRSRFTARFQQQAFNYVGSGNVQGTLVTSPDPTLTADSTNRDESNTELFARDAVRFGPGTTAWLGLRHTRLSRSSVDTSGNVGPAYSQSFTIPGVALSQEFGGGQLAYASWGQGVETYVTPGLPSYGTASGLPLPAVKSRQIELGIKGRFANGTWGVAFFDIDRPVPTDTGTTFALDGSARHRGIEANGAVQYAGWTVQGGVQVLRARREGSADASLNGLVPANVPQTTIKAQVRQDLLPGMQGHFGLQYEGRRFATPDNSIAVPAWTVADVGLRYTQGVGNQTWIWRAAIDNLTNRRAWRESPWQFEHSYLYPLAPRTLRASLEVRL